MRTRLSTDEEVKEEQRISPDKDVIMSFASRAT